MTDTPIPLETRVTAETDFDFLTGEYTVTSSVYVPFGVRPEGKYALRLKMASAISANLRDAGLLTSNQAVHPGDLEWRVDVEGDWAGNHGENVTATFRYGPELLQEIKVFDFERNDK